MGAATEKQLIVLKSSSKKTNTDGTQAVRSIVGDTVREQNNNVQKMQQIEDKLRKKERESVCRSRSRQQRRKKRGTRGR